MTGIRRRLHRRAHRTGLDGHTRINRQRRQALLLVVTGLLRVCVWVTMLLMYIAHLLFPSVFGFTAALFTSVAFVSCLSLYANGATDFGQVAASLAQLTAGDAHHDVEATRAAISFDVDEVERDLARLAKLKPGPDSDALAAEIAAQIARHPSLRA